jgi:hypothetical protein
MKHFIELACSVAKKFQEDCDAAYKPPADGVKPRTEFVIADSIVKETRGYIVHIVNQINSCYESGSYDACSVMIRRLTETIIIEAFEANKIQDKIKNTAGDYFYLSDLISCTLAESSWTLSRNTKRALPNLKDVGDKSAHSRRFVAHRSDIDKVVPDLRVAVQELLFISNLK